MISNREKYKYIIVLFPDANMVGENPISTLVPHPTNSVRIRKYDFSLNNL